MDQLFDGKQKVTALGSVVFEIAAELIKQPGYYSELNTLQQLEQKLEEEL